jgi:hypothetical protein
VVTLRGNPLLKSNSMQDNNDKSRGLGDTIAKVTKATGLNSLAQMGANILGKKDCGCNKRKEVLNKAFPYKK